MNIRTYKAVAIERVTGHAQLPWIIGHAEESTRFRFLEFFTANIRNPNTRRAYARAASDFLS